MVYTLAGAQRGTHGTARPKTLLSEANGLHSTHSVPVFSVDVEVAWCHKAENLTLRSEWVTLNTLSSSFLFMKTNLTAQLWLRPTAARGMSPHEPWEYVEGQRPRACPERGSKFAKPKEHTTEVCATETARAAQNTRRLGRHLFSIFWTHQNPECEPS